MGSEQLPLFPELEIDVPTGVPPQFIPLTDAQIEAIAERAAAKALEKMETQLYITVGRSFINKALRAIGVVILGVGLWLWHAGVIKLPELLK